MYTGELRFHAPAPSIKAALEHLADKFDVRLGAERHRRAVYLDTFDWRLYARGTCLVATSTGNGHVLSWRDINTGLLIRSSLSDQIPVFAGDVQPGPFADELGQTIDVRALLHVARVEAHSCEIRLLDRNGKVVVMGSVDRDVVAFDARNESRQRMGDALVLSTVRGYDKELDRAARKCSELLATTPQNVMELEQTLTAVGRRPLDYSSKMKVTLDPDMDMDEALRTLLTQMSSTMRRNEAGIFEDVDIEFLHDFRVSHRRTRTALDQFKKGFNPEIRTRFRPEFKWLGWLTNPVRDLDVYKLQILDYRSNAPEHDSDALAPLSQFLYEKRELAFRKMIEGLRSSRYPELMSSWEVVLGRSPTRGGTQIHVPSNAKKTASRRIWSIYEKILKDGGAIGPHSPAEALHRLRLSAKHLRYLLEMFRSMYSEALISGLISELKSLQDNLGAIQDLEVQRTTVEGFAGQMASESEVPHETMIAIGRLASELSRQQTAERAQFEARFSRFARARNQKHFRKLFR